MNFSELINDIVIGNILTPLIALLVGIALVVFLWGIVKYIDKGGDEAEREKARQLMIWGIVGLFVMVAVWGLVNILLNSFFPGGVDSSPPVPQVIEN